MTGAETAETDFLQRWVVIREQLLKCWCRGVAFTDTTAHVHAYLCCAAGR
jgi:hypothetical protein